jgi:hypothetical protein
MSPPGRWALTPPFHPYRARRPLKTCPRFCLRPITEAACAGGFFSVALSVAEPSPTRPPGVTRRAALRSPDFPPATCLAASPQRSPGPLASSIVPHGSANLWHEQTWHGSSWRQPQGPVPNYGTGALSYRKHKTAIGADPNLSAQLKSLGWREDFAGVERLGFCADFELAGFAGDFFRAAAGVTGSFPSRSLSNWSSSRIVTPRDLA